jgi:hypothetical protein
MVFNKEGFFYNHSLIKNDSFNEEPLVLHRLLTETLWRSVVGIELNVNSEF